MIKEEMEIRPKMIKDKLVTVNHSHQVMEKNSFTGERIEDTEIEKILDTRVVERSGRSIFYNQKVRLKNGREVTVRVVETETEIG